MCHKNVFIAVAPWFKYFSHHKLFIVDKQMCAKIDSHQIDAKHFVHGAQNAMHNIFETVVLLLVIMYYDNLFDSCLFNDSPLIFTSSPQTIFRLRFCFVLREQMWQPMKCRKYFSLEFVLICYCSRCFSARHLIFGVFQKEIFSTLTLLLSQYSRMKRSNVFIVLAEIEPQLFVLHHFNYTFNFGYFFF